MKRHTAIAILGGVSSLSFGQSAPPSTWIQKYFGLNIVTPVGMADTSTADKYYKPSFDPGNPTKIQELQSISAVGSTTGAYNNTWLWAGALTISVNLPNNSNLRVPAYIWEYFKDPPSGGTSTPVLQDYLHADIDGLAFCQGVRNYSQANKILWNLTPALPPYNSTSSDGWSSLGAPVPFYRDFFRPVAGTSNAVFSALHSNIDQFIYDVNYRYGVDGGCINPSTGGYNTSDDFTSRMAFQLGNEPASGHPGGSIYDVVGSWKGLGDVHDGCLTSLTWGTNFNSYAGNYRVMPALSFSTEASTQSIIYANPDQSLATIKWAEGLNPGLNEIATYGPEVTGRSWISGVSRRALHFMAPELLTVYGTDHSGANILASYDNTRRWETADEYATRWISALERYLAIVKSLDMSSVPTVIDVTEAYVPTGNLGYSDLTTSGPDTDHEIVIGTDTLATVREKARNARLDVNGNPPPKRVDVLKAIRDQLYAEEVTLSGSGQTLEGTYGLGRIYWWGGWDPSPRYQTGLDADDSDSLANGYHEVTKYTAHNDIRLDRTEIGMLFNVTLPAYP